MPIQLTVDTATLAELIAVSTKTVLGYVQKGLPGEKLADGSFRFDLKETFAWVLEDRIARLEDPGSDFKKARADKERAQARLSEMRLQEKAGELVPVDYAAGLVAKAFSNAKQRILGVPSALAPTCASESDPNKVEGLIRDAIYHAMQEIVESDLTPDKCPGCGAVLIAKEKK